MSATLYTLPVDRYSPKDKDSFAYPTVVKRWPTILTQIVSTVNNRVHGLSVGSASPDDATTTQINEGKQIISKLSELKHDMGRNYELTPIEDDGGSNVSEYNDELASFSAEDRKWFSCNWLFAECYLYRRLRTFFSTTQYWKEFDPFFASKAETYKSSSGAIVHLAKSIESLKDQTELVHGWEKPGSALEIAFMEMTQANLWGNATDLSLLVDLKYEDLQKLQSVGKAAQLESSKLILRNDLQQAWAHVKTLENSRLDIVLDNAGFELYTDFIFADFMLTYTPFVSEVVFHPKTIPWFVSDVLPFDFTWAIDSLLDTEFFTKHAAKPLTEEEQAALKSMATRWKSYVADGRFKLSVPLESPLGAQTEMGDFWTSQYAYQDLPAKAPVLLENLAQSGLVVFKGDLNYRKLVGDAKWSSTTSFDEALGPLSGKINLLSLRTNKADTIVGLEAGIEEQTVAKDANWRVSGKYAVVSFSTKK